MSRFRVLPLVSLLLVLALAVAACGPASAPAEPTAAPTAAPTEEVAAPATEVAAPEPTEVPATEEETSLVLVDGTEPAGLYPPTSTGPPGHLDYLLYDPLVGHDEKWSPIQSEVWRLRGKSATIR